MPKYCSGLWNKYDIIIEDVNKLIPNLGNKNKCVLYNSYINLQLYLSLGMKLVSVHRTLK